MIQLLLVGVVLAFVAWLVVGGTTFRLVFRDGRLLSCRGTIRPALRAEFEDIAERAGLSGRVSLSRGHELRFSMSISEADRQRFRNVFFSAPRGTL